MNENLFLQTQVQSSQHYGKVGGTSKVWVDSCVWVLCHTFLVLHPHLPPLYRNPTIMNFKCCISALYSELTTMNTLRSEGDENFTHAKLTVSIPTE